VITQLPSLMLYLRLRRGLFLWLRAARRRSRATFLFLAALKRLRLLLAELLFARLALLRLLLLS